jgi:hypothetical protein
LTIWSLQKEERDRKTKIFCLGILALMCVISAFAFSHYSTSCWSSSSCSLLPISKISTANAQTTGQDKDIRGDGITYISAINDNENDTRRDYTTYRNLDYGFELRYPLQWADLNPNPTDNYYVDNVNGSVRIVEAAKFTSPAMDNVTVWVARLVQRSDDASDINNNSSNTNTERDDNQTSDIEQFVNGIVNDHHQKFAQFQLLDVRLSPASDLNSGLGGARFLDNVSSDGRRPIFNLTYSAEMKDTENRTFPIKAMEVGSILNNTAYIISFLAAEENYDDSLPVVESMINSFELISPNAQPGTKLLTTLDNTTRENATLIARNASLKVQPQQQQNISSEADPALGSSAITQPFPYTMPLTPTIPAPLNPYSLPVNPYNNYYPTNPYGLPTNPYGLPTNPYNYNPIYPYNYPISPISPNPLIPPGQFYYPTILSYNTYNDTAGTFHIVGEVQNTTPDRVNSVQVIAAFYDLNQLLTTRFAYTNPSSIGPGQRAIFDLTLPPGTIPEQRVTQWTLNLIWQ